MKKILSSKIFRTLVGVTFYLLGAWALWSGQQSTTTSYCCSHPMEGVGNIIITLYAGLVFILMSFLLLWNGKITTIIIIIIALVHLPFGWERMKDPCYRHVMSGKGFGSEFESYNGRICISGRENDGRYWVSRTYKDESIDSETFRRLGGRDYSDKNCTLYEVVDKRLECIGDPDCVYGFSKQDNGLKCFKE